MITAMLMMLQSSVTVAAPAAAETARAELSPPTRPKTCLQGPSSDGEIIVCGRTDHDRYRLKPLTTQYDKPIGPGIGFDLGNGARGNAYTTQTVSPDGKPDKRIMVRATFPF